jgi:cytochrome bd ubiquinol oxidase subunit I
MSLDVLMLSRFQFALTIMFHYLFPPLSIGLGVIMVMMEATFLRTGSRTYELMTRFWSRIFAVNFAMGVATGIVMEFEFGTNWAVYSRFVGDVFGSALAAEGIFAFFLESGFLSVVVFGWDRVSPRMHFFATCMVSLGSIFSSVWIVIANSWQQTPAGFHIVGEGLRARAEITDFWEMVFNPSSMVRLSHVLVGSFILGAFFVMSVSAYYVLRGRHLEIARRAFSLALVWGAIVSLAAGATGHISGQIVGRTQPAKLAALEGHFHTGTGPSPAHIIGYPDVAEERVRFGIEIPRFLSLMVHDDLTTPVTGLDAFKPEDRPPVVIPFLAFHTMVGLGMGFMALTWFGVFMLWRGKLFESRWLMKIFVFAVIGPFIANQVGWVAAEVGRQPWIVYGLLRTSDALSRSVRASQVLTSLVMFTTIYLLLAAVWVFVLNSKIQHGPDDGEGHSPEETEPPARPEPGGLLAAAASLADPGAHSMTDAHAPRRPRKIRPVAASSLGQKKPAPGPASGAPSGAADGADGADGPDGADAADAQEEPR